MTPSTRLNWLKFASAAVMAFGPIVALGAHPATAWINGLLVDLVFWPFDGSPHPDPAAARLLSAITGGVMLGWGLMLWQVVTRLYPREPTLARSIILPAVAIWYVADSLGSIFAGAPLNAVLNLVFLALFWLPLGKGLQPAAA